jgi:hypothetical protein
MKKTSYETSKKLAEAGFKAETEFYWVKWNEGEPELVHEKEQTPALIEKVGAWDLETILEALPSEIDEGFRRLRVFPNFVDCEDKKMRIGYYYSDFFGGAIRKIKSDNESLANTAARLLLSLHEKNLI